MSSGLRLLAVFAFCSGILLPSARAQAPSSAPPGSPSRLQVDVSTPYRGHFAVGWNPVRFQLRNNGPLAVEAECRLHLSGRGHSEDPDHLVHATVSLSPGATKQLFLYVPLDDNTYELNLLAEVLGPDGRALAPARSLSVLEYESGLVLFVGRESWSMSVDISGWSSTNGHWYRGGGGFTIAPEDLPDRWIGYSGIDLVVLNECPFDDFTPEREQALLDWVSRGGAVLISPGGSANWLQARLLSTLWPEVSAPGSGSVTDLKPLEKLGDGKPFQPLSTPLTLTPPAGGTPVLMSTDGRTPLLSFRHHGLGTVFFLAADVSRPPLNGWAGEESFWRKMMEQARFRSAGRSPISEMLPRALKTPYDSETPDFFRRLATGLVRLPPPLLLIAIVVVYLVAAGPLNFFWMRRKGWHQWLGLSLLLIAMVTVAGVVLTGFLLRGWRTQGQRFVVEERISGSDTVLETQYYALCSAGAHEFTVRADAASIPMPVRRSGNAGWAGAPPKCRQGGVWELEENALSTWDTAYFRSEAVRKVGGTITISSASDGSFRIHNGTPQTLRRGLCVVGGRVVSAEAIPPGASFVAPPGRDAMASFGSERNDSGVHAQWLGLDPDGMEAGLVEECIVILQGHSRQAYLTPAPGSVGTLAPTEPWVSLQREFRLRVVSDFADSVSTGWTEEPCDETPSDDGDD